MDTDLSTATTASVQLKMTGDGKASQATPSQYQYEAFQDPTSQIRILALQPSRELDAKLCGDLLTRPINGHRTRYEALSYTWGTDQSAEALLLGPSSLPLPLGLNLRDGLRQLRHRRRTRYLWIDAICIDQQYNAEKTAQIAIMGQIYANARRTVIWLGRDSPTEDGKIAIAFFSRLARKLWYRHKFADLHSRYQMTTSSLKNFFSSCFGFGRPVSMIATIMPNDYWRGRYRLEDDEYAAILTSLGQQDMETAILPFLQRPWFRRRWIIQEVCLARKAVVLCGSHTLPWADFERVLSTDADNKIWHNFMRAGKQLESVGFTRRKPDSQGRRMTFRDCAHDLVYQLAFLDEFRCQDPRDIIAALLGLWTQFSRHKMIDYDLSVESNYLLFAAQMLDLGLILDVFCAAITRPRKCAFLLPSWVPDWRLPARMILPLPWWKDKFTPSFVLSRGPPPTGSLPTTLHIRSYILDTIVDVQVRQGYREMSGTHIHTALGGHGVAVNMNKAIVDQIPDDPDNDSLSSSDFHIVELGDVVCAFMIDRRFMDGIIENNVILEGLFVLRDTDDSTSAQRKCRLISMVERFRPGNVEVVQQAFRDYEFESIVIV